VDGQPHAPAASTPGKEPVPIVQEAGWNPGPVCSGRKSRPHRDSIPDRPAPTHSLLVSIIISYYNIIILDFPPFHTSPEDHTASCTMVTGFLPGVKSGRAVLLTTHPLLVPRSWKNRAIPLPTLWATPGL